MMSRNHVLIAFEALELGAVIVAPTPASPAEAAGWVATYGGAVAVGLAAYHWGALAPDLDHEGAVATAAYAPRLERSFHDGRLRPNPRGLLRYLVPGSHTLSAGMRLVARWWYAETRGSGDDPKARLTHRGLWHTGPGALVMALVVGLLVSPLPGMAVAAWFGVTDPDVQHVLQRGVAAVPVALMAGVAALAWNRSWKRGGMLAGFVAGCVTDVSRFWWVAPIAVYLGCYLHCVGDNCTEGKLPRWWAPFGRERDDGKRWGKKGYLPEWLLVKTGGGGEAMLVLTITGLVVLANWVLLSARFDLGGLDIWT